MGLFKDTYIINRTDTSRTDDLLLGIGFIEKEKLKFEKDTKDRVDISLKDYEELQRKLKSCQDLIEGYENEWSKFADFCSIPVELLQKAINVRVGFYENPIIDGKTCSITFDIDDILSEKYSGYFYQYDKNCRNKGGNKSNVS